MFKFGIRAGHGGWGMVCISIYNSNQTAIAKITVQNFFQQYIYIYQL